MTRILLLAGLLVGALALAATQFELVPPPRPTALYWPFSPPRLVISCADTPGKDFFVVTQHKRDGGEELVSFRFVEVCDRQLYIDLTPPFDSAPVSVTITPAAQHKQLDVKRLW